MGRKLRCPGLACILDYAYLPDRNWNFTSASNTTFHPSLRPPQPAASSLAYWRQNVYREGQDLHRVSCSNCETLAKTSSINPGNSGRGLTAGRCPHPWCWPNWSGRSNPSAATWQDRLAPPGPGRQQRTNNRLTPAGGESSTSNSSLGQAGITSVVEAQIYGILSFGCSQGRRYAYATRQRSTAFQS
jgi:hypothetical protein